jgi:hypothetical protein
MSREQTPDPQSPSRSGSRYVAWIAFICVATFAVSAAPLYMIYQNGGNAVDAVFGDPFNSNTPTPTPREQEREAASIRPEQPPALRSTSITVTPAAADAVAETVVVDTVMEPPAPAVAVPPPDTALESARARVAAEDWDAALRSYERLQRQRPADQVITLERARALAWSGNPAAAATALEPLTAHSATADLRLERARYLWWAGMNAAAETLLGEIVATGEAPTEAMMLRSTVRAAMMPSVPQARRWLAEERTLAAHLWLARALAREAEPGEAVTHLRRAVDGGATPRDTLLLELSAVAMTADSMRAAADALERYLREYDASDRAIRLRLARAHAWSGEPRPAIEIITALLNESAEPELFHERARLHVAAGDLARAEADLLHYLTVKSGQPEAVALLADIARWRASPASAEAPPASPRPAQWRIETESFGDSESFRWHAIEAHRSWVTTQGASVGVTVRHEQTQGAAGGTTSGWFEGYGASGSARLELDERWTANAGIGLRYFTGAGAFPMWTIAFTMRDGTGMLLIFYEREPAVRRASTAAALEAGVASDRLRLASDRYFGGWALSTQLEGEHLGSDLGSSQRLSGSAWLGRPLAGGLSASIGGGALTSMGDMPHLPGWGPLYWMPRYYVAPTLSLRYEASLTARLSAAPRIAPAYVFVAERAGADRRFPESRFAASGLGLDINYAHPAWHLAVSADWSGALEAGYRAAALRVRIVPRTVQP